MSYTNHEGFPQGNPMESKNKLLNLIREMKIGELKAIQGYTRHIKESNILEVKERLKHIRDEEIEHYNELNDLIFQLDAETKTIANELATEHKYKYHKDLGILNLEDEDFEIIVTSENTAHKTMCNIIDDMTDEEAAIISYETSLVSIEQLDTTGKYQPIIEAIMSIVKDEKEHILELVQLSNEILIGKVTEPEMEDNATISKVGKIDETKSLTEDKMAILSPHIKQIKQYLMDNYPNYKDMSLTMFIDDEDNARTMISEVRTDFITK